MTANIDLSTPLQLSDSCTIKNRTFKSAMSEQLGDSRHNPTDELVQLYRTWAEGGTGLLVTGNVMIDRTALGEPKNVVLDEQSDAAVYQEWAAAGTANDTQLWMQLNHPGKQIPNLICKEPVAPSAVPLGKGLDKSFNTPRALESEEIEALISKFAYAAGKAKAWGFTGVQIHGAHGYLVSQFLSPHHNRRDDQWGGSLENRMRFLLEVYRAIRAEVGPDFPVGVKLNSADFQRGGFTEEESMQVIQALDAEGMDLIEISGGNYENPSMVGAGAKDSTIAREAYFLEYAEKAKQLLSTPLVVTGGFRSAPAMNGALASGATDMIGLARPLAVQPDMPNRLLADSSYSMEVKRPTSGIKMLDTMAMLDITWFEHQLKLLGQGKPAQPDMSGLKAVFKTFRTLGVYAFQKRRA